MRDSNPRYPFEYNGFQDRRLKPLGQSSICILADGAGYSSSFSWSDCWRGHSCGNPETPRVRLCVEIGEPTEEKLPRQGSDFAVHGILPPMRTLSIRLTALALALGGAWAAYTQTPQAGQAAAKAPAAFVLHKIADDLYVIDGGGAGNVAVYITSEGVILVDDKYEQHFDEIMANVKKVTAQPVRYIINTHYHADHSGGNTRFTGIAQIISTTMARENILKKVQSNAPANMVPASLTFKDEMSVFLGGKEVRAIHLGRGHTGTDAMVYFPVLKVLHSGDAVTNGSPLIDYPGGGSIVEWTKTLDRAMKEIDFDTLIPGHGPISPKSMMQTYRNNAETLRMRFTTELRTGKSQAQMAEFMTANYNWQPTSLNMQWSLPGMMQELK